MGHNELLFNKKFKPWTFFKVVFGDPQQIQLLSEQAETKQNHQIFPKTDSQINKVNNKDMTGMVQYDNY